MRRLLDFVYSPRSNRGNSVSNTPLTGSDIHEFIRGLNAPYGQESDGAMFYHRVHAERYAVTLNAIRQMHVSAGAKVLELAAGPYGMTSFLRQHLFTDLTLATFADPQNERDVEFDVSGDRFTLKEFGFNVEQSGWPFPDNTFDLVIACELVEHLAMDPMALFAEANRILKPGGRLFISTPNAASLQNFIKLASFYPAGLAPHFRRPATMARLYERHNREYSPETLAVLYRSSGFDVEMMASDSSYPLLHMGLSQDEIDGLLTIIKTPELRRDTLNMSGVKVSGVVERYPTSHELYIASDG